MKRLKRLLQPGLDTIFAMRQLFKRSIEYNQNLYNISIDQEQAFDLVLVNRDLFLTVLD